VVIGFLVVSIVCWFMFLYTGKVDDLRPGGKPNQSDTEHRTPD